jgi:Ala-tRNA(Pro) deacylase
MKTTLYDKAPKAGDREDLPEGRPDVEMMVYRFLDKNGISYRRADHDRAMTMEDCVRIEKVLKAPICKNLFLCNRQKTNFYLLLMPGDKPFKTREISHQIGSARLSFGPEEELTRYLGCHQGSASVLGLMNDKDKKVRLIVDEDLKKNPYIGCHPCNNTSTLKLHTSDVFGKFLDAVQHDVTYVHLEGV